MSNRTNIEPTIILLLLTAFTFREAAKKAQTWGAFRADQLYHDKLRLSGKLLSSSLLIIILPLLAVAFFWGIAETAPGESICAALDFHGLEARNHLVSLTCPAVMSLLAIFSFGLFPKGTKHLWLLVGQPLG